MTAFSRRGTGGRMSTPDRIPASVAIFLAAMVFLGLSHARRGLATEPIGLGETNVHFLERAVGWDEPAISPDLGDALAAPRQETAPSGDPASNAPLREWVDLETWGTPGDAPWMMQVLPQGLIYRSYLAGVREPRIGGVWNNDYREGWMWDIALGGRVGLLRYGTTDPIRPQGWELDLEGGAFPRLDMEHNEDLVATDYRVGVPLTYGTERFQTKLAFYHLSSHLGDEYMVRHHTLSRINYSRNALVWGNSLFVTPSLRLYGEAAWSFYIDGGAKPWEFQFGADYSPPYVTGLRGSPFMALNSYLRQEDDFGGHFVVQTGWQWRGESGQLFRMGMQYFAGSSDQLEIYTRYESKVGLGLWYDF